MIDDFGVISAERTFKGYSQKHRMIKLDEYISLLQIKTVSCRFLIDWTKTFEAIKSPHSKQDCFHCDSETLCSDCVKKT